MSTQEDFSFLQQLPKIELHAHLGGSVRDSTIQDLMNTHPKYANPQQRSEVMQQCKLSSIYEITKATRQFNECFALFGVVHNLTDNLEAITRITREVVEDYNKENCVHLEIRTTPRALHNLKPAHETATTSSSNTSVDVQGMRNYIESVIKGIQEFNHQNQAKENATTTSVGIILSINRSQSLEVARETVKLAAEYKSQGIIGLDFSGNPHVNSFANFKEVFEYARRELQLKSAIHCGEILNDPETNSIIDFNPERIGHGTHVGKETLKRLNQVKIPLEVCLTSNYLSGSIEKLNDHPIAQYYEDGYPIAIACDDKGIFNTSLTQEFQVAEKEFGLNAEQTFKLTEKAIDYSFASAERKHEMRQLFEKTLAYKFSKE